MQVLERLIRMDQNNKLHHGYLCVANSLDVFKDFAQLFTEYQMTHELSESNKTTTIQKIKNHNHPDVFVLSATDQDIKIDDIRDLQKWLMPAPYEGPRKLAFLENAHQYSAACFNALLKTLEEPPSHATLFIHTSSSSRILPTIRSRLLSVFLSSQTQTISMEETPWVPQLESMLLGKSYSIKEAMAFSESLHTQRDHLNVFFKIVFEQIRYNMTKASSTQFNRLEKLFDLAVDLENELFQNYGNVALGLDHFFIEWKKQ